MPTRQRVFDACNHFFVFLKTHVQLRDKILVLWVRPSYHADPAHLADEWEAHKCGVPDGWNELWNDAEIA